MDRILGTFGGYAREGFPMRETALSRVPTKRASDKGESPLQMFLMVEQLPVM